VEDNPADALLVRKAFEAHQIEGEITILTDGEMAIRLIEGVDSHVLGCPDLVIIDLNLPKKPGREVLRRMRQSETCREVPVLILSSSDAHADRADAILLGASRYIRKPTRLDDFLGLGAIFKETLGHPK
jgi:chemotaxis family two-component system response regulator Rcp1